MGRHPWSLTLRQLLETIERDFGGVRTPLYALGPRGRTDLSYMLRSADQFATLLELDPDEELAPSLVRSLCVQLGIPPEVFGLEQEEPYRPDVS